MSDKNVQPVVESQPLSLFGDLLLVHNVGAKSHRDYYALVADLGYTRKFLSFDSQLIAELLSLLPRELSESCPLGSEVPVVLKGKV